MADADTRYGSHKFHPYSAKYIPQIPNYIIDLLSQKGETVLDVFSGSGTTLVEAQRLGRKSIGVDMNPIACLISKVKTTVLNSNDQSGIMYFVDDLESKIKTATMEDCQTYLKDNVDERVTKWFQINILIELTTIKQNIDHISNKKQHDFLLVAFSSILRRVSDAASGFGNLMISKDPPLKSNAYGKFKSAVKMMCEGMNDQQFDKTSAKSIVYNDSAKELNNIQSNSIDLICTHPPYMAAVPYAEYQKLSMWWLGINNNVIDKILIGGQRRKPDMGEKFIKDMQIVMSKMFDVLKPEKYCAVVIGNPVQSGKIWKLDEILSDMGKSAGFELLVKIPRGKYKETVGKMKKEFILLFKKN